MLQQLWVSAGLAGGQSSTRESLTLELGGMEQFLPAPCQHHQQPLKQKDDDGVNFPGQCFSGV